MIRGLSSSVSALIAFGKKMGVIANNVANLQSDGFKKSRALLKEGATGGVHAEVQKMETPGDLFLESEEAGITQKELSNVDLAEEISESILTKTSYKANLKVIETEDEILGALLDTKG